MKVKLLYFRAHGGGPGGLGGKYYAEGEFELEADPPSCWKAIDEAMRLRDEHRLPGLMEGPGQGSYHVLVATEPESVPHLLVAPHFINPCAEGMSLAQLRHAGTHAGTCPPPELPPGTQWAIERLKRLSQEFSVGALDPARPLGSAIRRLREGHPIEIVMGALRASSPFENACHRLENESTLVVLGVAVAVLSLGNIK